MSAFEIWLLAVSLAIDCFTVSVTSGIILHRIRWGTFLKMGFFFGLFQALMPFIGWLGASRFSNLIEAYDHWIAFGLLAFLGIRMIREHFRNEEESSFDPTRLKVILTLAVATSIDALSVGFTISEYGWLMALAASLIIAVVTFFICMAGLRIGKKFGTKLSGKASVLGGVILIGIGLEIFISGILFTVRANRLLRT